jgi:hypothetical protein
MCKYAIQTTWILTNIRKKSTHFVTLNLYGKFIEGTNLADANNKIIHLAMERPTIPGLKMEIVYLLLQFTNGHVCE